MTSPGEQDERPLRPCNGCATFDRSPRHEVITFDGADTLGGPMHMDCCAEKRNCDVCKLQLQRAHAQAGEVVKDDALRAALGELSPLHFVQGATPFEILEHREA